MQFRMIVRFFWVLTPVWNPLYHFEQLATDLGKFIANSLFDDLGRMGTNNDGPGVFDFGFSAASLAEQGQS